MARRAPGCRAGPACPWQKASPMLGIVPWRPRCVFSARSGTRAAPISERFGGRWAERAFPPPNESPRRRMRRGELRNRGRARRWLPATPALRSGAGWVRSTCRPASAAKRAPNRAKPHRQCYLHGHVNRETGGRKAGHPSRADPNKCPESIAPEGIIRAGKLLLRHHQRRYRGP